MHKALLGLEDVIFYKTPAQECSYLPDTLASFVFANPDTALDLMDKTELSQLGFRRNGHIQYRPDCAGCSECLSVRLVVDLFKQSRSHARVSACNQQFKVTKQTLLDINEQHSRLYQQYLQSRHNNPLTQQQAASELRDMVGNAPETHLLSAYGPAGALLAFMVCDEFMDGVSAVYTCYDTSLPSKHSLGTWMILQCIAYAQQAQLPYVYLGYYVKNSRKMNYKVRFGPLHYFVDGQWRALPANEI